MHCNGKFYDGYKKVTEPYPNANNTFHITFRNTILLHFHIAIAKIDLLLCLPNSFALI